MELKIVSPKLTTYQKDILDSDERFTITEAATKCGKTIGLEEHLATRSKNFQRVIFKHRDRQCLSSIEDLKYTVIVTLSLIVPQYPRNV